MKTTSLLRLTAFFACSLACSLAQQATESVWIEAENVSKSNVTATGSAWNKPELLSGGKALQFAIAPADAASKIPAEGILLTYDFEAPATGDYELWNRVGYEGVRAPFEWRLNGGEWVSNSQKTHRTIDVVETAFWNPIGWSRLGNANLQAGKNTLEVRINKVMKKKGDKEEPAQLLYVSDAFVFSKAPWTPNHQHKPGDAWMGESDKKAAAQTFQMPAPAEKGQRTNLDLNGLWQYAAWDEMGDIPEESRTKGVEQLPDLKTLNWRGIRIPSDRNKALPEFAFNHRYLLRARVEIPADFSGKSFLLDLREINFIATLFVNGHKAGDFDTVLGFWKPDITALIEPGKSNEIVLVMKDIFYALRPTNDGDSVRTNYYLPMSIVNNNQGTTNRFDYPVRGAEETGILEGASLIAKDPVNIADVGVRTSVTKQELAADVTIQNFGTTATVVEVKSRVEPWPEGQTVLTLPSSTKTIAPGASERVDASAKWADAALWWPDDPKLYQLVTDVKVNGQVVDTLSTRFGFREWEIRGNQYFLNGVRQQLRSDLLHFERPGKDLKGVMKDWRDAGITMFRLRFQYDWGGRRYGQTLDAMDEAGMPVRLHVGSFDGQMASYSFGPKQSPNTHLFENWHKQILNRAKEWRNHPSVFVWELDNEIIFINARNTGSLDLAEPPMQEADRLLKELDPTRSSITGGGNALRNQSLPAYGIHYFEVDDRAYPDEAYTIEKSLATQNSGGIHPWPVDFNAKPIFMSETAFLPGRNPAGFAAVGGETTFLGKSEAKPAAAKIARWLTEGYRWKGIAAFHFWFDGAFTGNGHYISFQPVALFCRQWNWTFASGQPVSRDLKAFNETRFSDPVEVEWQFFVAGKKVAGERKTLSIAPGGSEPLTAAFKVPAVKNRTAAEFVLTASQRGKEVFRESKKSWVIDPESAPKPKIAGDLLVWDPQGSVEARLKSRGIAFKPVRSLAEIPAKFGMLVLGKNAVPAADAANPRWLELAGSGAKILAIDQDAPLRYQALPADLELSPHTGHIAFPQESDHPVFDGLKEEDFFTWSGNGTVYRNAYRKATAGARSLAHCDDELAFSVLSACPVNNGMMLLSQFDIGDKLGKDPVATRLFDNMLNWLASYKLVQKKTAVVAEMATPAGKALDGMGMSFTPASDPLKAITSGASEIVVVQASKNSLRQLAENLAAVKSFTDKGGWIMIMGITPETLADFDKIVGVNHILRPFRQEKVLFASSRDPLTAGLGLQDVVMSSGERIQIFNRDEWPVDDAFQYVVDLEDIAPFSKFPGPEYWGHPNIKGPGNDCWPLNMVNGFLSDTHWRMIFSIHLSEGEPTKWDIEFPREEEVIGFSLAPNATYHEITKFRLIFDGNESTAQEFDFSGSGRQDFEVSPVKAKKMTVELLKWNPKGTSDVIGVDNLWIRVKRPEGFAEKVKPMLNIGGLVRYPMGTGGIILNQYNFIENEKNPANAGKKQTLTATLLKNLGASFAGGRAIIAGSGLRYQPVALDSFCNLYLKSDQGFPLKDSDLSALPVGNQKFAGVDYAIRDFATSPLESGVMLQNPRYKIPNEKSEVKDIPVGRKADALFFLHTLLPGDEWRPRNDKAQPPIVFQYTVRYDDGTSAVIPVDLGVAIAAWRQTDVQPLRKASVAWRADAKDGKKTVVYQMQWTNPRPDKSIRSVDIAYGPEKAKWGAPILLGLTAAEAAK